MKKEMNIEDLGKISGGLKKNKDVKKWESILSEACKKAPVHTMYQLSPKIPLNCIGGECYAMQDESGKMVEYHFHSQFMPGSIKVIDSMFTNNSKQG